MFDLLIARGAVYDGMGSDPVVADVAVSGGRVAAIDPAIPADRADSVIDAAGMAVTPGFIDIHTHADIAAMARPELLPYLQQGVTTVVFSNCGLGFAPVAGDALADQRASIGGLFGADENVDWSWCSAAELVANYEARGIGTNVAYLVPHGALRAAVVGQEERRGTSEEVRAMVRMLEAAIADGAFGMSTGLWYAPMRAADHHEIVRLAHAAGFLATHQRDYGEAIDAATAESLAIARESGARLQISHLQLNGAVNRGRAGDVLAHLDKARHSGIDVACDVYPYTAGSTLAATLLPAWAVAGGPAATVARLSDADEAAAIAEAIEPREWSEYRLSGATSVAHQRLDGLDFMSAAREARMSVPAWICALLRDEELSACYIRHSAYEENVRTVLAWPHTAVGSDGLHLDGRIHPRLHGCFAKVLSTYVRDAGVLRLADAVRRMSGLAAHRLGLKRRGVLTVGAAADICVFSPAEVRDMATYEEPRLPPTGVRHVLVNGVLAVHDGAPTLARAGHVLRPA